MLLKYTALIFIHAVFTVSESLYQDEKRLYNFGLGKRGYPFLSQYKRLPVYNFGLGKRSDGRNMYAFGLGKRDPDENTDDSMMDKRGSAYNFGLGKRIIPASYSFELGKKAVPQYSFGLGKRLGHYNFGLGKRTTGKYGFGLGKKDKAYSFGLGKRYDYFTDDDDDEDNEVEAEFDEIDDDKRNKYRDGQKFSFGLGKREDSVEDLLETAGHDTDSLPERQLRTPQYNFGLGKRSVELPANLVSQSENKQQARQNSKTNSQ